MTANRWWVKAFARWKARIAGVRQDIGLFFQGLSGVGISSSALKYLGAPMWAIGVFLVFIAMGVFAYAYYNGEGGVWNQVNKDKRWMSNDWAGPNGRIVQEIGMTGLLAGMKGRTLTDDERQAVQEQMNQVFVEYADGIDPEKIVKEYDDGVREETVGD